jgi:hypothetical protein
MEAPVAEAAESAQAVVSPVREEAALPGQEEGRPQFQPAAQSALPSLQPREERERLQAALRRAQR